MNTPQPREVVDGIQCSFELGGAVWKIRLEKDKNAEKKNEN